MCSGPHTTRGWVKVGGGVGWGGKMKNNKQDEEKLKIICVGGCVWVCVWPWGVGVGVGAGIHAVCAWCVFLVRVFGLTTLRKRDTTIDESEMVMTRDERREERRDERRVDFVETV